jgi:hypothetical protein
MFNICKKYSNVWMYFIINDKEVLYINKDDEYGLSKDIYINGEVKIKAYEGAIRTIENNFFNLSEKNINPLQIFDIKQNNFIAYPTLHLIRYMDSKGRGMFYDLLPDLNVINGYADSPTEKFKFIFSRPLNAINLFTDENYFLCYNDDNRKTIERFCTTKKAIVWNLSVSEIGKYFHTFDKVWKEGQVWHFVGVVDGILWIDVNYATLLGIDVEQGTIKHTLKQPFKMNQTLEEWKWSLGFYPNTLFDIKSNQLFGITGDRYYQIELDNHPNILQMWVLEDQFAQHSISVQNPDRVAFDDTHLFFIDAFNSKIGALNRKTLQLDWVHQVIHEPASSVLMKVDVTENHLFVLDNAGTLHIFEKVKV